MELTGSDVAKLKTQRRLCDAFCWLAYLIIVLAGLRRGYAFKGLLEFRRKVWAQLDGHDGPVIWAANHLTLVDSFLIFWAVFPWHRLRRLRRIPWSTPEYANYYKIGGPIYNRFVRAFMYLCRCIPFLRKGEDEFSVRWREKAFEKCAWVLRGGGTVFVFPEATRSRSGWFERRRPKDFLGSLLLRAPEAKVLAIYLRGERQALVTANPARGESFRMDAELFAPSGRTPREISQEIFDRIAELQERWFKGSIMPKNCGGNDVVDLKAAAQREHFEFGEDGKVEADLDWVHRHLTPAETAQWGKTAPEGRYAAFWRYITAKEAASKALAQAGVEVPRGAYKTLEADIFANRVIHLPTQAEVGIRFTDDDENKIHCVAALRGGLLGDSETQGDALWGVEPVPAGEPPSDFVRRRCLDFIVASSDDIPSAASLAFTDVSGIPKVLRGGKIQDWGVSLSHSGRYAAYSFMVS